MTEKDRQLLLKDLCARLPYRVRVQCDMYQFPVTILYAGYLDEVKLETGGIEHIDCVKPYLRPMSSMTEEECITLSKLIPYETDAWKYIKTPFPLYIANIEQFDFFHRHHLDWRGLILKGLALEAPEGMYNSALID